MSILFWISLALIFYAYVGYACLLFVLASMQQLLRDLRFGLQRRERRSRVPEELPSVSLVFSAFNEEAVIQEKMRNCARLKYPPLGLEVLVGCDGCTDATAALARAGATSNTRVFDYAERRGKPNVINDLASRAQGEIVVFSDANTMLLPDALMRLVRHFQDPAVGCVSGELTLTAAEGGTRAEGAYWRYEVFLKFLENRLNMLLGANGALFAIRRRLFSPLPARAIIDDFLIAMSIRRAGYRVVYDPEAVATELEAGTVKDEFRRRVRIGTGNFHALRYTWSLLSPTAGSIALAYWSHKVFRWLVPFALLAALCSALVLASQPFFALSAALGIGFCAVGAAGYFLERHHRHSLFFRIPYYFLSMNLALALGLVNCVSGRQMTAWARTPRLRTPAGANSAGTR